MPNNILNNLKKKISHLHFSYGRVSLTVFNNKHYRKRTQWYHISMSQFMGGSLVVGRGWGAGALLTSPMNWTFKGTNMFSTSISSSKESSGSYLDTSISVTSSSSSGIVSSVVPNFLPVIRIACRVLNNSIESVMGGPSLTFASFSSNDDLLWRAAIQKTHTTRWRFFEST